MDPVTGEPCVGDDFEGVYDCAGVCITETWAETWPGDSYCDDERAVYGAHLDCEEFDFDGGDCADEFDPSGLYEGTIDASLTYDYGWWEVRYECTGDLTGAVDMAAEPQIEASGICYGDDGEAYPIVITGNFEGETPYGTILFDTDDPLEDSWSGEWARDELEGEWDGEISSGGWETIRYDGDFELIRIED